MQQISKKCPYCAAVYEQRAVGGFGRKIAPEDLWTYGSPVRLCDKCKRVFIDKDIRELAITELRKADTAKISAQTRSIFLVGALLAVLFYALGQTVLAAIALGVTAVYSLMDLCLYPTRMKKLDRERQASEKRLSDPEYARMLKKAGIDVPDRYLQNGGTRA